MSMPQSSIRVFVQWTEQTVFAGEDIECQITFRNVAATPTPSKTLRPPVVNGLSSVGERQRKVSASHSRNGALSPRPGLPGKGHRSTLSLNVASVSVNSQSQAGSEAWNGSQPKGPSEAGTHKRSLSIISMGATESNAGDEASNASTIERSGGMSRGHGRSASLQIVPRRHGVNGGPTSGKAVLEILKNRRYINV